MCLHEYNNVQVYLIKRNVLHVFQLTFVSTVEATVVMYRIVHRRHVLTCNINTYYVFKHNGIDAVI